MIMLLCMWRDRSGARTPLRELATIIDWRCAGERASRRTRQGASRCNIGAKAGSPLRWSCRSLGASRLLAHLDVSLRAGS